MTQSNASRSIIDTHRHIFGPKLLKKFIENIGFDDSKPLPQANAGEMFFYRESVDVDYSIYAGDRNKIFSTNTFALLRSVESAPRLVPQAA